MYRIKIYAINQKFENLRNTIRKNNVLAVMAFHVYKNFDP